MGKKDWKRTKIASLNHFQKETGNFLKCLITKAFIHVIPDGSSGKTNGIFFDNKRYEWFHF